MLDFFISYIPLYTYLVLFLVTLLTSFVFPFPATALIIASWAFAAQGFLDIRYVLFFSFLWCVIGDTLWYLVSFFYWKRILHRLGFKKIIKSPVFLWLEKKFKHNSTIMILLSRFLITGLCSTVNIISWLAKIKYKKFVFLDILWEIIYVLLFAYIGYYLWSQWQYIALFLEDIITITVFIIIWFLIFKLKNKKNKKK